MSWRQRIVSRFARRSIVLAYHRVVALPENRLGLGVRPEYFDQHLAVLRELGLLHAGTSMTAFFQQAQRSRTRAAMITFDDGYDDNLNVAVPLLRQHGAGAIMYVATGWLDEAQECWWDELEHWIFHADLPPGPLRLPGLSREFLSTDRDQLLAELLPVVQSCRPWERRHVLDHLRSCCGAASTVRSSHHPLTRAELRNLADTPGIRIGAHTINHPFLPHLTADEQEEEIAGSCRWLEQHLDRPVTDFSYPHGGCDATVRATAARCRLATAVTNEARTLRAADDPLAIPRVTIHDWDGPEFRRRLLWWLSR